MGFALQLSLGLFCSEICHFQFRLHFQDHFVVNYRKVSIRQQGKILDQEKRQKKNAMKEEREHIETKKDSIVFRQAFVGGMKEEGDMSYIKGYKEEDEERKEKEGIKEEKYTETVAEMTQTRGRLNE